MYSCKLQGCLLASRGLSMFGNDLVSWLLFMAACNFLQEILIFLFSLDQLVGLEEV